MGPLLDPVPGEVHEVEDFLHAFTPEPD
jgi:hypothetical protein